MENDTETVLYWGQDSDGDQIEIIGYGDGEVMLRVTGDDEDYFCSVILDQNIIAGLFTTLMAVCLVRGPNDGGERVQ
jgi:hypothetical protein